MKLDEYLYGSPGSSPVKEYFNPVKLGVHSPDSGMKDLFRDISRLAAKYKIMIYKEELGPLLRGYINLADGRSRFLELYSCGPKEECAPLKKVYLSHDRAKKAFVKTIEKYFSIATSDKSKKYILWIRIPPTMVRWNEVTEGDLCSVRARFLVTEDIVNYSNWEDTSLAE